MRFKRILPVFGAAFLVGSALFGLAAGEALAQTPAPTTPDSAKPADPAPPAATPAPQTPAAQATPATPLTPPSADTDGKPAPGIPADAATQMLEVPSRPVAMLPGKSDWDNGFKSIMKSIATVEAEVGKAGLKQAGKPIAVFVETGDNGFSYQAMVPLMEKPDAQTQLGSDVKLTVSPAGKAIKFQHRGAYDDIDSTYDLITAYLDEKGLEAQNLFIEEYLTDTKNSDDQALEIDIYVFIKG